MLEDNNKMVNKNKRQNKRNYKKYKTILKVILCILLYIWGLQFLPEVGINYDEQAEQEILKMNILEYAKFFAPNSSLVSKYKNEGIIPISESVEKDHGIAPFYLFAPLLTLKDVHFISYYWHLTTYTLFFIGVIALYLLIKKLWKNDQVALLTSAIYFFTPRIFSDSLYNNKDCVLLTFVILSLYFGIRFITQKNYKNAILFGIVCAIACNIKISGFYIFAIIGLFYILELTNKKNWNKKNFLLGCTAIFCCLFFFILITPAIWCHGFHPIEYLSWSLQNTVRFSRNWGRVWFEGIQYQHSTNHLPWYYLPKIMFLTIPIYVILLFFLSLLIKGMELLKREKQENNFFYLLFITILIIPLTVAMISNPNIYNGWRHFYFLYIPILVIVSYALIKILQKKNLNKIVYTILILLIFLNGYGIIQNGVSSSLYYNLLANNPSKNYEMDYYGIMPTKVLKELASELNEPIHLYSNAFAVELNYKYLTNTEKEKIILLKNEEELNDAIEKGEEIYYYYSFSYDMNTLENVEGTIEHKELLGKTKIKEYKSWKNVYAEIYK